MLKKYRSFSMFINQYAGKWVLASAFLFGGQSVHALTGGDVLNKMNDDQRFSYLAGVVGGLAYSRYLRDKPDRKGMDCIYDWYYQDQKAVWPRIETWLKRHVDKPAEPLIYVLVKKECGE